MATLAVSSSVIVPPAGHFARFASKHEARDAAIELARAATERSTVITVPRPYTPTNLTWLCRIMAEASERIAALVVEIEAGDDVIYGRMMRKARELASAEGAALIWCETVVDPASFHGGMQAIYRIKADLTCLTFERETTTWLCGKEEAVNDEIPI